MAQMDCDLHDLDACRHKSAMSSCRPGSPNHDTPSNLDAHAEGYSDSDDDVDSALGDDDSMSTISLTESILEYRNIHGRTYHSESHGSFYWGPNDERSNDAQDISHHVYLTLLENKLFLAPLQKDKIQRVLDVGTGTGIWANDFADEFPGAEVIGTDISPIQPAWTAPNCRFEMEDAEKQWTFPPASFDYIHMRTLQGSIQDWPRLFRQCYAALRPGGWIESYETDGHFSSDDHEISKDSTLAIWSRCCKEANDILGRPFNLASGDVQLHGMEAAGFKNIHVEALKSPIGAWSPDPRLKKSGLYAYHALEQDLEGYMSFIWTTILQKPVDEMHVFLAYFRKELRNERVHVYLPQKIVYAQKPFDTG